MRVAIGAVAKQFLPELGIETVAHVTEMGFTTNPVHMREK